MRALAALFLSFFLAVMPGMAALASPAGSPAKKCGQCACCVSPQGNTSVPAPAGPAPSQRTASQEQAALKPVAILSYEGPRDPVPSLSEAALLPFAAPAAPLFQRHCVYLI